MRTVHRIVIHERAVGSKHVCQPELSDPPIDGYCWGGGQGPPDDDNGRGDGSHPWPSTIQSGKDSWSALTVPRGRD